MKVRNESTTPVRINDVIIIPRQTRAIDDDEWRAWIARASGHRRIVADGKLKVVEMPADPEADAGVGAEPESAAADAPPAKRRRGRVQRPLTEDEKVA